MLDEDGHSQCSLFSVLFAGLCLFREGSVPGLLWDPLLRVALLDVDAVLLQEAICCRSSVETVTMHSSEGSEAAAAHELFMRGPTLCRDFKAGMWAVKWMVDKIIWQRMEAICCIWGRSSWMKCTKVLCWDGKTLTVCTSVSSSRQRPNLVCLWFEAGQWRPLMVKALCALCTIVCWDGTVWATLMWAITYKQGAQRGFNQWISIFSGSWVWNGRVQETLNLKQTSMNI